MKHILDSLLVWVILAMRHSPRVLAFAFILFACVGPCDGRTGHWFAVAKGLLVGFVVGVAMVFPTN